MWIGAEPCIHSSRQPQTSSTIGTVMHSDVSVGKGLQNSHRAGGATSSRMTWLWYHELTSTKSDCSLPITNTICSTSAALKRCSLLIVRGVVKCAKAHHIDTQFQQTLTLLKVHTAFRQFGVLMHRSNSADNVLLSSGC